MADDRRAVGVSGRTRFHAPPGRTRAAARLDWRCAGCRHRAGRGARVQRHDLRPHRTHAGQPGAPKPRAPGAVGMPEAHPPMRSLLAVPIVSAGRVIGNLYLAEKQGAAEFSAEDENTLTRFATQAAQAIENARLHLRVRDVAIAEERERIAREMHDSLAQVLGYVMTKAQAVQELLKRDESAKAAAQVAQLNAAARDAYADVREGILALRTSVGSERGVLQALREYLERWKEQSGLQATVEVTPADERLDGLSPLAELQLLRIVQEALANVRKHAHAQRVDVCITVAPRSEER